jgi:hypothetical protein
LRRPQAAAAAEANFKRGAGQSMKGVHQELRGLGVTTLAFCHNIYVDNRKAVRKSVAWKGMIPGTPRFSEEEKEEDLCDY